jgi:hypothetical protein
VETLLIRLVDVTFGPKMRKRIQRIFFIGVPIPISIPIPVARVAGQETSPARHNIGKINEVDVHSSGNLELVVHIGFVDPVSLHVLSINDAPQ